VRALQWRYLSWAFSFGNLRGSRIVGTKIRDSQPLRRRTANQKSLSLFVTRVICKRGKGSSNPFGILTLQSPTSSNQYQICGDAETLRHFRNSSAWLFEVLEIKLLASGDQRRGDRHFCRARKKEALSNVSSGASTDAWDSPSRGPDRDRIHHYFQLLETMGLRTVSMIGFAS
jgi:hypothetical protein